MAASVYRRRTATSIRLVEGIDQMRLSLRLQKCMYAFATSICIIGSLVIVAWGIVQPTGIPDLNVAMTDIRSATVTPASVVRQFNFAGLYDRLLRRPLFDPPPEKPVVREQPPLRIDVLGT